MPTIEDAKRRLRSQLRAVPPPIDPACGEQLADRLIASQRIPPGVAVAGFWPFDWEIDCRPLLHRLHMGGWPVLLPQTPSVPAPLIFRLWQPGATMERGPAGTWHPTGAVMVPDWLLVPMLAFDRQGGRLGYGGGYYDRTLAALAQSQPPAQAIGCAWSGQEIPLVPMAAHDIRLPMIMTEAGLMDCGDHR